MRPGTTGPILHGRVVCDQVRVREAHSEREGGAQWVVTGRGVWAGYWPGRWCVGGVAVASVIAGSLPASAAPTPVSLYVSSATGAGTACSQPSPCATIQQAISNATGGSYTGDDVTINVAGGTTANPATYTEINAFDASSLNSLTIAGAGASTTTVNGGGAGSVFTVNSGTVTISGLTVTNGMAGLNGGGIDNAGTLTVTTPS